MIRNALVCFALILLGSQSTYAQTAQSAPQSSPAPGGEPPKDNPPAASQPAKTAEFKSGKLALALPPEKAQPVRLPRFDKPPVIDGKLDDEVWKHGVVLKDFIQVQPGDNIAPSKPTEVMLGYDAKFLYIAFHCYDEPDKVRANIAKRDNIFDDDYVGILFDTFNDTRKAYEFDFNPLGVQADGIWTSGQGEDFSLDIVMESKGSITSDGYTIEVAMPFKSLRYVSGKDKLWGVHFWRRIKRFNNELDMWMPLDRDKSNWLAQEGHLTGFEGISTERTLELIPSLTLSETGKRKATLTPAQLSAIANPFDPGKFVNEPIKFDPGLTGKYTITPNVTLDFALNPDFAQVEADQLVVTANQRFPIFFPEKRPFFLEGIDIFQTQIAAVHTRAIVDPDLAVKLTGKVRRNTFGLLVASDNAPGNLSEADREFIGLDPATILGIQNPTPDQITSIREQQAQLARILNKNSMVGVLRLKRDIGKSDSFIGFLGTHRRFVDQYNELGGFDGRFRIDKQTTFSWQALGTRSRRFFFFPEQGQSLDRRENGFIYAFDYNKNGRHFGHELSAVGRTRYYRADVGFNRRVNTNNYNWFVRYSSEPRPKAKLISWRIFTSPSTNFDWQGHSQNFNNNTQLSFNFRLQGFLGIGVAEGYERVFEEEFGRKRTAARPCTVNDPCTFAGNDSARSAGYKGFYVCGGATPSKKYNFFAEIDRFWGQLDYDFGAGPKFPRVSPGALLNPSAPQDPGPGDFLTFQASFVYQPTAALKTSLDFNKQRLVRYDTGRVAFDENIISLRSTYQFTRFIFARGRVDFDSIAANVKAQFLFGYTPNPGTAFYVGYNDDLNRNGFNRFTGQLEPGFRRNGRTFFIKMSYLFRRSFK